MVSDLDVHIVCRQVIMLFVAKNTITAAAIRIIVLIGVNEQVALYPKRQGLLACALGITVLTAAILKMKITT